MAEFKPLLIEIGCEELPPKALDELAKAFVEIMTDEFGILYFPVGKAEVFCSPRRIAARFADVGAASPKSKTVLKAVPVRIGWDEKKQPTPALLKKAAQLGASADAFRAERDDPNAMLICDADIGGEPLARLLPGIIERALKRLPIPKPMRWGDHDYAFVRPVHWFVLLHGDKVIDAEIFGIRSGRESRGHRFHHPLPVSIANPAAYVDALRGAKVLVDPAERRKRVRDEVERVGRNIGGTPRLRDELLDEIANLTEWPVAIACDFERDFLRVPQEALIQTMETNQKFVPVFEAQGSASAAGGRVRHPASRDTSASVRVAGGAGAADGQGKLTEHFIGVANIESKNPAEIRKGYERVIRPRFADARFFYDEDLKVPLISQQEALKTVTYQQQLGSLWDKSVRVAELARVIGNRLGVDAALATRAAALSKCDLMTRMVGEFPELQGVMGRYYATANGEHAEVAQALDEFYRPRFAGDSIAEGHVARVLAVAERLDTLAGIFAVGMKPSGNKDPFALRRAALGLARTLIEAQLDLDLDASLREAVDLLPEIRIAPKGKTEAATPAALDKQKLTAELRDFIFERLRGYYAEQGFGAEQFEAVRAVDVETLIDFDRRLRAVAEFSRLPDAQALAAANKRIGNILRQAGGMSSGTVEATALDAGAETDLHQALREASEAVKPLVATSRYVDILRHLAALREPVDRFFDGVMVMTDDAAKRNNRLVLLSQLRRLFLHVADISLLPAPERATGGGTQ
jgi:glycyl-tRNA synthetase beta chain